MDQEPDLKYNDPDQIRRKIEETRASLTDKLEALEHEVKRSAQNARDAVVGTVETVKHSVEDTVDTVREQFDDAVDAVKESLDVRRHVRNYPWAMVGGSTVAGFITGRMSRRGAGAFFPRPPGRWAGEGS
jgi:ElaB/YqjD/DUF883 family membrane-anchored ribosome-binding protein